jgi:transcriptional regulator with XRE-family HTH domain
MARKEKRVDYGEAFRARRLALNLTQDEVARRAGIRRETVTYSEKLRDRAPKASTMRALAGALETTPTELRLAAGEE